MPSADKRLSRYALSLLWSSLILPVCKSSLICVKRSVGVRVKYWCGASRKPGNSGSAKAQTATAINGMAMESRGNLNFEWTLNLISRWNGYGRFLFPNSPNRFRCANKESSLSHGKGRETSIGQVVLGQQLVFGGRCKNKGLARFVDKVDAARREKEGSRTCPRDALFPMQLTSLCVEATHHPAVGRHEQESIGHDHRRTMRGALVRFPSQMGFADVSFASRAYGVQDRLVEATAHVDEPLVVNRTRHD